MNRLDTRGSAACVHFFSGNPSKIVHIGVLVLVLSAARLAVAVDTKSQSDCGLTAEEIAALNVDPSHDIHALRDFSNAVARMLENERFAELDCLAVRFRATKERFPGGMWKLHTLYTGIYSPVQEPRHATEHDWQMLLDRLERWKTLRPQSITARVALATAYVDYAWAARGDGYADTVSDSGWQLFGERTRKAMAILEEAYALPDKCPEWFMTMQRATQNQDADSGKLRTVFEQAVRFEPSYYYYARIYAQQLEPQWSGKEGLTEQFMKDIAGRTGGDDGDILYFQIASMVVCGCGERHQLSWPRIVNGFQAAEKRYGTSVLNLNLIAYLASHGGNLDPVIAQKALKGIGDQWDEEKWQTAENFESTKRWAETYAPAELRRRDMEMAADANIKTREGLVYKMVFEKKFREIAQHCVDQHGGNLDKFEVLASLTAKGTIEQLTISWNSRTAACIYQTVHDTELKSGNSFPRPPRAPFAVRLDLDGADFVPANLAISYRDAAARGNAQEKDSATKDYFTQTLLPYFGRKYGPVLQSCFTPLLDPTKNSFSFVAAIGTDGRVQRLYSDHENSIYECMRGTLQKDTFPSPPVTPYYFHVDMNLGNDEAVHSSELED